MPSEQELVTAEEALDRVRRDLLQRRLEERRFTEAKVRQYRYVQLSILNNSSSVVNRSVVLMDVEGSQ